ncbi:MAG: amidohydrolase family protein [Inquilinaceae bacterium]
MVAFPIIDSHVHIYDPSALDYPWMAGVPALDRPHLIADFDAATAGVAVDRMIFVEVDVEPRQRRAEVRWVAGQAEADPRMEAIVAAAPLEKGAAVREDLEAMSAEGRLRGIRRLIQDEKDPRFCTTAAFVEGVNLLPEFGLSFDICVRHHQLPAVITLVERCPDVRFVLDHIGKPAIRDGLFQPWADRIDDLAGMPNVHCKISGVATEADPAAWTREQLKPYLDHVVEAFGFDRVLFGGDWPVSTLATDYRRWVETVEWAVSGCSDDELRKLFRENARTFYRLA